MMAALILGRLYMQESFHVVLNIQELDINMIRLMRVKKERLHELEEVQD